MPTRAGKSRTPQLIGATEASQILQVDKSTLTRWAIDGTLPPIGRLSDRRNSALIFDRADVEHLAAKRAAGTEAAS